MGDDQTHHDPEQTSTVMPGLCLSQFINQELTSTTDARGFITGRSFQMTPGAVTAARGQPFRYYIIPRPSALKNSGLVNDRTLTTAKFPTLTSAFDMPRGWDAHRTRRAKRNISLPYRLQFRRDICPTGCTRVIIKVVRATG